MCDTYKHVICTMFIGNLFTWIFTGGAPYAFIEYIDEIYTGVVPTRMLKGAPLSINEISQIREGRAIYEVKILSLGKKDVLPWYIYWITTAGTLKECKQDQEKYDEDDEDHGSNCGEEDRENLLDKCSKVDDQMDEDGCQAGEKDAGIKVKDAHDDGKENVKPRQNKRKQVCCPFIINCYLLWPLYHMWHAWQKHNYLHVFMTAS